MITSLFHITYTHGNLLTCNFWLIKVSSTGEMFCDTMNVLGTLPHHGEGCGPYHSIWQWQKTANICVAISICSCIVLSMVRGTEDCTCAFPLSSPFPSSHTPLLSVPVCCLSTFFLSPHHSCLSSLPSPFPSLPVQGDESGCVRVCKSTPQGFTQPAAWKIHDAHKGVWVRVCLCMRVCSGAGWGGGMGLEKGNKERQRKGKEGGGIRVQSVRQIDGAQQG